MTPPAFRVGIDGGGIAAAGCARLLGAAGTAARPADGGEVPMILLSDAALALLRDVFARPDLFEGLPRVWRRVVDWGGGVQVLPHGATIVSGAALRDALATPEEAHAAPIDFTVHAAPPPGHTLHRFGDRCASAVRARLHDPRSGEECRIEAVASGWLFLMPAGPGEGWLLAIGDEADALLGESRTIAPLVIPFGEPRAFDVAPRLAMPLAGPDWLGCGSAAIGFDPICGDGAAQAAREAILAAAVLTAIAEGGDAGQLLAHYQAMLVAAMRRHLALCAQFYATGGQAPWWRAQHAALVEGHAWCTRLLAQSPEPAFVLHGFRLEPRRAAA